MDLNSTRRPEPGGRLCQRALLVFLFLCGPLLSGLAAAPPVPPPEKLLPDDTLFVITATDFPRFLKLWQNTPQSQLWEDPAMKPFKDNFLAKWRDRLAQPLERDLNLKLDSYTNLLQGQLTFAITRNGWQGSDDTPPGLLFLLDAKGKSGKLKKDLAELRRKWVDAGKTVRVETIRGIDFLALPMDSNNVPQTVRRFFPKPLPVQELGAENQPQKSPPESKLLLGQADSLLIAATSTAVAEKVLAHLAHGDMPALADNPAFQANHLALFRDSPLYAWLNAKTCIDVLLRKAADKPENPEAPTPYDFIKPDKIARAVGVTGLNAVAVSLQVSNDGALFQFFLGVPETGRQGLFKLLVGEPKEADPPPFVPADAVRFQRWRLDGQKTWAAFEKMLGDFSPQAVGVLNFIIETANANAREKDPGFDLRKNLVGNLGDDVIRYQKAPRGPEADPESPPSICLIGSPNPEQLAAALKNVLVFLGQQAGAPSEREFLGRKIYSAPLPPLSLPFASGAASFGAFTLQYAASGGYVAFSSDASILEEYLRSSESQAKTLRELPGLAAAAEKVTGPATSLFGYQNQAEIMRAQFDVWKKNPGDPSAADSTSLNALRSSLGVPAAGQEVRTWMDFSLLPTFDKVSKYFYFSVCGAAANIDGLTLKFYLPAPPQLKTAPAH
jgi:hypothetical protein